MTRRAGGRRVRLVATITAAVVALAGSIVVLVTRSDPVAVTVMTRNLYLGADITRPIRATQERTGRDALLALGHANAELRRVVEQTDFGVRGPLVAAEIAGARPDLVGLQEVALWRHGPLELDRPGVPDATAVDEDFLTLLLGDLARRGVPYDVVQVQAESDVEAPAFTGDPAAGADTDARDVRLTMRDVILVRHDSTVRIRDRGGAQYTRRSVVQLGGVPYAFVRGYAWADVSIGSRTFRFLTTHLESQSGALAAAQAQELVVGPARDTGQPVIVVCDCNANPPAAAAYQILTRRAHLRDGWVAARSRVGSGATATLGELLQDPSPASLDRRIDLVLARPGRLGSVTVDRAEVTGGATADRDPATGLWPSDHAGVVVRLQLRGR